MNVHWMVLIGFIVDDPFFQLMGGHFFIDSLEIKSHIV